MNKHPIPKRASLTLERATTEVKTDASTHAAEPVQRNGCLGPLLLGLGLVFIAYLVWNMLLIPAYTNLTDRFAYGKSRISETAANVGHGGESTFLGLVENGQITVIELVGTPPKHMVYVVGTADTNHLVVTVSFQDVAGKGRLDMIVKYNGGEIVLYNTGSTFTATP